MMRFSVNALSQLSLCSLLVLGAVSCATEAPDSDPAHESVVSQKAIAGLPPNLNLMLNAKTTLSVGPETSFGGSVAASGAKGSVLIDVGASQNFFGGPAAVLGNTVNVRTNARVQSVIGNLITLDGSAGQELLGLDPSQIPQVPAPTAVTPGKTALAVAANQARQLCPGQYGAITLADNAVLNLNGGVYEISRLSLANGARLEPSEPVVILISGGLTTIGPSTIQPSAQALNPMSAADIRIEVGTAATFDTGASIHAHLLVPNGKLTVGDNSQLRGAAWAKSIVIGANNNLTGEGVFALTAPQVPPPCNDNNACTTDTCVGGGTAIAVCRNTPTPAGSSCEDGNLCNGAETCDGAGACQAGTPLTAGTSCTDGNVCNGAETCNGLGTCIPGTPPPVDDHNTCTTDTCDPTAGVSHTPLPDGTACSVFGTCGDGVCSFQGTVFSQSFLSFTQPSTQCTAWKDFEANQLTASSYNAVTVSGTFDQVGTTCSDPGTATQICQALHTGATLNVFCDGHEWSVGPCEGGEISIDTGGTCFCDFSGTASTVRPCGSGFDWGGVHTETCDAQSQTMNVICQ